jgi:RNA polymerase sigma factor (sigma-70 family)
MLKSPDSKIVEGIRKGDKTILAELYRDMLPSIKRLAAAVGLGPEDARDVFQDAIVVVFEKAGQPGFILSSQFSTYFYGICRNILGNKLKKKSGRSVTMSDDLKYREDEHAGAQTLLEEAEKHRLFHKAFGKLGDDCRKLLEMAFEDIPPETIMAALEISSNDYFRRRKYLCKEKLVQLVQSDPSYKELKNRD